MYDEPEQANVTFAALRANEDVFRVERAAAVQRVCDVKGANIAVAAVR
jgi:hypothetical protein